MTSIAAARVRNELGAWEVTRLYLPDNNHRGLPHLHLLEMLAQQVGEKGGHKIFLRVADGSSLEDSVRSSGFLHCFQEVLLEGYSYGPVHPEIRPVGLAGLAPHHQHGLFQLYSTSTPDVARKAVGDTFAEWNAAREWMPGNPQELIFEKDGKVRGWLCSSHCGGATHSQIMTHPDEADLMPRLVERALSSKGRHLWLVPRYQTYLVLLLTHRGFKEIGAYSMLAKDVTVRLSELHYSRLEAIV